MGAVKAIRHLGEINGFEITPTDTSTLFTDESLSTYSAVVFLNRSGLNLDFRSRVALERFMQSGLWQKHSTGAGTDG